MSKHTEGPWVRVDRADYAEIHPASGRQKTAIALVARGEDADLVAAAPELLQMLKVAQIWLDVDGRYDMHGINAAIAKAEGRS